MTTQCHSEEPTKPHHEGSDQACAVLRAMALWKIPMTFEQLAKCTEMPLPEVRAALVGLLDRRRVRIDRASGEDRWALK